MYGLVNKAVRDLVIKRYGESGWQAVRKKAGVDDVFVAMSPFPDEVTFKLVGAASELTGQTPDQILEGFGVHWVLYTAAEGYGPLLGICGDSFVEFLQNMDDLHERIRLIMPALQPPTLKCTDIREDSMRLHYHSERSGLAPMVVGLLKGLGQRFETAVDIVHEQVKGDRFDHDVFLIRFPGSGTV